LYCNFENIAKSLPDLWRLNYETDIKRNLAIQQIFDKYKKMDNTEYLNMINNDLIKFIGYYVDLEKAKDREGMRLWRELDKRMFEKKEVN
jgi:hypothetical protein